MKNFLYSYVERFSKKERVKNALCAFAVFLALLLLLSVFATIDSSALEVPTYETTEQEFAGKGNLNAQSALALVNYMEARYKLGYYEIPNFFLVGRLDNSSQIRLYTANGTGSNSTLLISGNTITITGYEPHEFMGDSITGGAPTTGTITFNYENVLCFVTQGIFTSTVNVQQSGAYAYGTGNLSDALTTYYREFTEYANKILSWDGTSSSDSYDEGYADGLSDGRTEGYNEGYQIGQSSGYTTGYYTGYAQGKSDGYNEGYEAGFAVGEAEGGGGATDEELEQEYQRGYEVGYREGTDYGYEQGYNRAVIDATPNEIDVQELVVSVASSAREILDTSLGFEIFGFNVAATIVSVIVVLIVAFVVKRLLFK